MMDALQADPNRWLWACLATLAWLATLSLPARHRRHARRQATAARRATPLVVAYASQGGSASTLADALRRRLPEALQPAAVLPLDALDLAALRAAGRACFVVSTTGAGDPPDHAVAFLRRAMTQQTDLSGLSYSLLALGDRRYEHYCGFGRALDDWLQACGAHPVHARIEVDRLQSVRLADWHRAVDAFLERAPTDTTPLDTLPVWRLSKRQVLNPGSPGAAIFRLDITPDGDMPDWQAGDTAQIAVPDPETGGETWREYTLCSLPADGQATLLLRQTQVPGGAWGLGAHWLGRALHPGAQLRLRIRANPGFHPPPVTQPLLLIGHGTGLAGLAAHLRARELARAAGHPAGPCWLLYGERSAQHDAHLDDRLQYWLTNGTLTRLDRAYSRSDAPARYVQDLITTHAPAIRDWVLEQGAALYICGRRDTMGAGVHAALATLLGADILAQHEANGHYRRDVY